MWSIYFGNNQFGQCYFQFAINLVPTINSLMEIDYGLKITFSPYIETKLTLTPK